MIKLLAILAFQYFSKKPLSEDPWMLGLWIIAIIDSTIGFRTLFRKILGKPEPKTRAQELLEEIEAYETQRIQDFYG